MATRIKVLIFKERHSHAARFGDLLIFTAFDSRRSAYCLHTGSSQQGYALVLDVIEPLDDLHDIVEAVATRETRARGENHHHTNQTCDSQLGLHRG